MTGSNILKSSISTRPLSTRGYVMGARTAPRFQQKAEMVTPGPATYQPILGEERRCQPAHVPFSSSSPRFPTRILEKDLYPGPGNYDIDQPLNRKVTWPMKFGAPDWAAVPALPRRMVKLQVQKPKEFQVPPHFFLRILGFFTGRRRQSQNSKLVNEENRTKFSKLENPDKVQFRFPFPRKQSQVSKLENLDKVQFHSPFPRKQSQTTM
ncbi:hypothetical protein IHE44_0008437 [Lamprotornis superbus]|uniref:Protein pitchfork n=1 Tax=Lamprotornis superbus TaxID=245042 RepID=A0A835TR95_9PASS|nr:hypothetical protein IHE44_0008437 [Lamprotornis superbus]